MPYARRHARRPFLRFCLPFVIAVNGKNKQRYQRYATRALAGHNASRVKTATRSLTWTRWNSSPAPLPLCLLLVASQRYTAFALKNLAAESETSAKRLQLAANRAWISWPRIKPSRKVQIFTYLYTHTHTYSYVSCLHVFVVHFVCGATKIVK